MSQRAFSEIAGRHIVIEEKIDGANKAISFRPEGDLPLQSREYWSVFLHHTTEQYMMAQKAVLFCDMVTCSKIMAADNPSDYKALGREVQFFEPVAWDHAKYDIVLKGKLAKFGQNPELWDDLDGTGDSVLVEVSPFDGIWGVKPGIEDPNQWRGENLLGFALMEARDIPRERWEKIGVDNNTRQCYNNVEMVKNHTQIRKGENDRCLRGY